MSINRAVMAAGASAAILLMAGLPVWAQQNVDVDAQSANYNNPDSSMGVLSDGNFNTPEADGRPGVYFFALGVDAFRKHDYKHALEMYKVAASWAYKPAEYNLGVMYYKGQGIPADHARGAAWMILAAERGDKKYAIARDLMVTHLSKAQFAETDKIWNELKPTYGDAVALHRAKAQWRRVSMNRTGTHVGSNASPLVVGAPGMRPSTPSARSLGAGKGKSGFTAYSAMGVVGGNSVDGSIAYQEMNTSDNPYDPRFNQNRTGTATVGPLQQINTDTKDAGKAEDTGENPAPASSSPL